MQLANVFCRYLELATVLVSKDCGGRAPSDLAPEAKVKVTRPGLRSRVPTCPCRIFKPGRTDGEAHPRLARRARVLPSGRRAELARPS
jgi:hypothetical protein